MTGKMGKKKIKTLGPQSLLRKDATTDLKNLYENCVISSSDECSEYACTRMSSQDLLRPSTIQAQSFSSEKAEKRKAKKAKQKERKRARNSRQSSETNTMWQLEKSTIDDTQEEGQVSLCKCPMRTIEYFLREIPCLLMDGKKKLFAFLLSRMYNGPLGNEPWFVRLFEIIGTLTFFGCMFAATYLWITLNDSMSMQIKRIISWHSYWIFLGVLSSVGLGTGLHTFVLYLGPFIAKVTLAAEECFTLDFPEPPYPEQIICSSTSVANAAGPSETVSILDIMQKVRWECLSWGLGTALGELPPYFMARAARLAGRTDNANKLRKASSSTLLGSNTDLDSQGTFGTRAKAWISQFVEKVGFWGILACASIPNPLFDLAGLTCGHFLIPFLTFFGATLIGKMVVKSQLQMVFVILAFNEHSLARVLQGLERIPFVGPHSRTVFAEFVDHQRASLHNKDDADSPEKQNIIQYILEKIVLCMVLYFIISIINGMAESYHERLVKEKMSQQSEAKRKKRKMKAEE
ncbi:unnamed protein product [Orchesella dallaii]|uniref:Vacuole membrane protein 1 n=1 Tax=Orchesella dallaii TaxID=48710 RepID=A0ABP1RZ82_9HEXA